MKYVYEEYETIGGGGSPRRNLAEQKIRKSKGYGFFKTFQTDEDLGEAVHLTQKPQP